MYGVVNDWEEITIMWYDTLQQALDNAAPGDIVIKKIEEITYKNYKWK